MIAAFCGVAAATAAELDDEADDAPGAARTTPAWKLEGGAGAALRPRRRGDNGYLFSPFPIARLSYGDLFEASTRDGVNYALFATETVRFGPELELDRKERQSTRRLGPLSTTFGTGGAGAFGEWRFAADSRTRLDVTEGVFGREGLRMVWTASRSVNLSEPLSFDLGVKAVGGDRRYVASAYGLPAFRALPLAPGATARRGGARLTTLGPTLAATYQLTQKDVISTNLEAGRAVGVAAHSPAVRALGTRNAVSLELAWRRTLATSE